MPTERMEEVEVVCEYPLKDWQDLASCPRCAGKGVQFSRVPKGSLTAARLRLADAAEKWLGAIGRTYSIERINEARRKAEAAHDEVVALRPARGEG